MQSGVMACPDSRIPTPSNDVISCELFSGGYSGWSQAMRRLTDLGHPFSHRIAVDNDHDAAMAFRRSHDFLSSVGPDTFVWGSEHSSQLPLHRRKHDDAWMETPFLQ